VTVTLVSLAVTGPDRPEARIDFRSPAMLVRGPSDTGKSYIRDCLWYLLGGDKTPKKIPQAHGYDALTLTIASDDDRYEIVRGMAGGDASIRLLRLGQDGATVREPIDDETGEFLVRLSGAQGKQLLRSKSKKGAVTGGDLRHWFLLSQPNVISEDATSGVGVPATQRIAAFHLFLTGSDDSAIQLAKTAAEVERISGQIMGAEQSLVRLSADIASDVKREDVAQALERVDAALSAMTRHYEARAAVLKDVRSAMLPAATGLQTARNALEHSRAMVERFELLDQKYRNDVERLGATWEGMSMFQALEETACPLCGTPAEAQVDPRHLKQGVQDVYRRALKAEVEKVSVLRHGLVAALERERARVTALNERVGSLTGQLTRLEAIEANQLRETRVEFSEDPKALALRRSELSELLAKAKRRTRVTLSRNVGEAATTVAGHAKDLLGAWGFTALQSVALDPDECDLVIDGRPRLDYGAGKRAVFLAAMAVALMKHALAQGNPHLGFVVIDSPLKSYADPKSTEQREVAAKTLTDHFYDWMAKWQGPGQVVILENQEIQPTDRAAIDPVEFTGVVGDGRPGFYPAPRIARV
jgi:hypothetical protein